MVKSSLVDGTPIFAMQVRHLIRKSAFAMALTNHFWRESENFPDKIAKSTAEKILKRELFFHGIHGENSATDGVGDDHQEQWNNIYQSAIAWIETKYPYLNTGRYING